MGGKGFGEVDSRFRGNDKLGLRMAEEAVGGRRHRPARRRPIRTVMGLSIRCAIMNRQVHHPISAAPT